MRGARWVAVSLFGLLLLTLALAQPASAHAQYVGSQPTAGTILPTPPASVRVTLSEDVNPASASIKVTNASGARFDTNGTRLAARDPQTLTTDLGDVTPGIYTVSWSATSAVDGHFSAGTFAFGVQDENGSLSGSLPASRQTSPAAAPAEVAIRAATYFSTIALAGAIGLLVLIWRPASQGLSGSAKASAANGLRVLLLWGAGSGASLAAFTGAWAAYTVLSTPTVASSGDFQASPFLFSLEVRVVLAISAAAVLYVCLFLSQKSPSTRLLGPLLLVAFGLAGAIVLATSLASHSAAALAWQPIGAAADAAHLAAVCGWVGGLFSLFLVRNHLRGAQNCALARGVLERFARFAFLCVGAVLLAGLTLGLIQIGSLERVTRTTYGLVVLAKASLFAPMVALGAINHYKSVPLLKEPARALEAAKRVTSNVRLEAALGAVVIVLAGLLTSLVPAAPIIPQPSAFILEQSKDGLTVTLQVYPPPTSPNQNYTISTFVTNATTGGAYLNATNASLRIFPQNGTSPSSGIPMDGPHGNHFVLYDYLAFPSPGTWRLDVALRRTDGFDVRVTYYVHIEGA